MKYRLKIREVEAIQFQDGISFATMSNKPKWLEAAIQFQIELMSDHLRVKLWGGHVIRCNHGDWIVYRHEEADRGVFVVKEHVFADMYEEVK